MKNNISKIRQGETVDVAIQQTFILQAFRNNPS
jgi:hypothetical protein